MSQNPKIIHVRPFMHKKESYASHRKGLHNLVFHDYYNFATKPPSRCHDLTTIFKSENSKDDKAKFCLPMILRVPNKSIFSMRQTTSHND